MFLVTSQDALEMVNLSALRVNPVALFVNLLTACAALAIMLFDRRVPGVRPKGNVTRRNAVPVGSRAIPAFPLAHQLCAYAY